MAHFIRWVVVGGAAVTPQKRIVENHTIFLGEFLPEPSPQHRNFLIYL